MGSKTLKNEAKIKIKRPLFAKEVVGIGSQS